MSYWVGLFSLLLAVVPYILGVMILLALACYGLAMLRLFFKI